MDKKQTAVGAPIVSRAVSGLVLAGVFMCATAVAQASTSTGSSADTKTITITAEQEQQLLAAMGEAGAIGLTRYYYPSLGAGVPTGFGANWGDVMFGVSGSNSDKVRNDYDGSMSFTLGLGNSSDFLGLEFSANNLSMRNFGDN